MGARLLLKRNDISARYVGQALMVTQCQPVQIDYIFWIYKVGQHCYALLPVMHNDKLYKVLQGSTNHVSQAPRIDCSLVMMGVYKDAQGIWRMPNGRVNVHQLSDYVNTTAEHTQIVFDTPIAPWAIETRPVFTSMEANLIELSRLQQQVNHLINYSAAIQVDPEEFKQTMADNQHGAKEVAGLSIHTIRDTVSYLLGSGGIYSGLLNRTFHAVTNALVWTLVIAIIGLIIYYLSMRYGFVQLLTKLCCCWLPTHKYNRNRRVSFNRNREAVVVHDNEGQDNPPAEGGSFWRNGLRQSLRLLRQEQPPPQPQPPRQVVYNIINNNKTNSPQIAVRLCGDGLFNALVDTGATISLVSTTVFEELHRHQNVPLRNNNQNPQSITGHELRTIGAITIPIKVATIHANIQSYVMQDCPQDVILGIDALTLLGRGSFSFKPGYLYFGESPVRLSNVPVVASTSVGSPATIRLAQNIILPPRTTTLASVLTDDISKLWPCQRTLVPVTPNTSVLVPNITMPASQGPKTISKLPLINYTENPIYLYQNTTIAKLQINRNNQKNKQKNTRGSGLKPNCKIPSDSSFNDAL